MFVFANLITIVTDLIKRSYRRQSLPSNQYTEKIPATAQLQKNEGTGFTGALYLLKISFLMTIELHNCLGNLSILL